MKTLVNEIIKQSARLFAYLFLASAVLQFLRLIPNGILIRLFGVSGVPYDIDLYQTYFRNLLDGVLPLLWISIVVACVAAICKSIEYRN